MPFSSFSKEAVSILKEGRKRPIGLYGVVLFIDISDFTSIVEEAESKGQKDLEALFDKLEQVFSIIHESISKRGGEVAFIAGDALLAYFLDESGMEKARYSTEEIVSELSKFDLKVKGGVSKGSFFIAPIDMPYRRDFIYYGPAVDEAASLENKAQSGSFLYKETSRVQGMEFPEGLVFHRSVNFYHPEVLSRKLSGFVGEWRNVASMFVNFSGKIEEFMVFLREVQQSVYPFLITRRIYLDSIYAGDKGYHLFFSSGTPVTTRHRVKNMLDLAYLMRKAYPGKLRIGITNGKAITGFIGSRRFKKFTSLGESVNIAARLMQMARIDDILFYSSSGYIEPSYRVKYMGPHSVKGEKKKINIYRVEERINRRIMSSIFVDREKELKDITGFIGSAERGVVFISGEGGVGKTALIKKIMGLPSLSNFSRLVFSAQDVPDATPYSFIRLILKDLYYAGKRKLHQYPEFREVTENILNGVKYNTEVINNVLPGILNLLLPDTSKVLFVIDDWHLIDEGTRDFLLRFINQGNATFVVSSRVFDRGEIQKIGTPFLKIHLKGLNEKAIADYARKFMSAEPHPLLLNLLKSKTSGNPFALVQTITYISEKGLVRLRDGYWVPVENINIPDTAMDVFLEKFDSLNDKEREMLRVISCFGNSVSRKLLDMFYEYKGKEPGLFPIKAVENGIITAEGDTLKFTQQSYRDAIYNTLLVKEKKKMHNEIAEFLVHTGKEVVDDVFLLAGRHYFAAENKEKAVEYLDLALKDDSNENNIYRKIEILRLKADAVLDNFHILLEIAELYAYIGLYNRSTELLMSIFTDDRRKGFIRDILLARAYIDMNELEKAGRIINNLPAGIEEEIGVSFKIKYLETLGLYHVYDNKPQEALQFLKQALNLAEKTGNIKSIVSLYGNMALVYYYLEYYDRAIDNYRFMLENLENDVIDQWKRGGIYINIGNVYQAKKQDARAIEYYKKAIREAKKYKLYHAYVLALFNVVYTLLPHGRLDEALKELKSMRKYIAVLNFRWAKGRYVALMGEIMAFKNEDDSALKHLNQALLIFLNAGMLKDAGVVYSFLLAYALINGDTKKITRYRREIEKQPFLFKHFEKLFSMIDEKGLRFPEVFPPLLPSSLAAKFMSVRLGE